MSRWTERHRLSARDRREMMPSRSAKDRYAIVVSAEPGCRDSFRWEIVPPGRSDPRLESGYVFASRRAAILDARFFLLKEGRPSSVEPAGER